MPAALRFNGATPSQTWKPEHVDNSSGSAGELQWSHAFSDVETFRPNRSSGQAGWLQWSHAFSDVETLVTIRHPVASHRASMEPRLLRRGNPCLQWSYGRGYPLQWSHAFSDV